MFVILLSRPDMKNYTPARRKLKELGWRRMDRANIELWRPPWDGIGFEPTLISFKAACKRAKIEISDVDF